MRSFRSRVATRNTTPVSSPFLPGFQVSAIRIAYVKSSSGAVVSTATTAISAPVFARSSSRRFPISARTGAGTTPATSVTKPCGAGSGGSAAPAARASAAATIAAASGLAVERVDRLHDALHLREIRAELRPERAGGERRGARAVAEHRPHRGKRAEHALAGGDHVVVAVRG